MNFLKSTKGGPFGLAGVRIYIYIDFLLLVLLQFFVFFCTVYTNRILKKHRVAMLEAQKTIFLSIV